MNILEVKNLTKTIGKKKILDDISFSIEEGKIIGLVGVNGAGKSTLLKTIVGLYHIDKGNITINNYDLKKDFDKAISIVGAMIEEPAMYDYLTGEENLNLFKIMLKNVSEEKVKEIVKLVSLEGSIYKKLKTYSLGMRQRLGLAHCLLNNPKLIILDEPTNGLDPLGINDLRNFLKSLKDVTIIISSHILSEIENICDEAIFIDKGKIIGIKKINHNKKYKFYVDDKLKAKILLSEFDVNDNLELEITENEIPEVNKILVDNNIKIFKICESKDNLEEEFLSVIKGTAND